MFFFCVFCCCCCCFLLLVCFCFCYLIASRIPPGQVSRKMQSQYGPTSAGKGHEKRRPWVQKGSPQVKCRPPPRGSSGVLLGVLGAKSASEGRSGRKRGVWKLKGGLLEPSWGPLGASWAHFGSHSPPPGGPRGGSRRSFLDFFGTSQPRS